MRSLQRIESVRGRRIGFDVGVLKGSDVKPRYATKELAEKAIKENPGTYAGAYPMFVSALYTAAHGVEKAGWYFYAGPRNSPWWAVK
jgi:hypothetical protein